MLPPPASTKLAFTLPQALPSRVAASPGQHKACLDLATVTAFPGCCLLRPKIWVHISFCLCRSHPAILLYRSENSFLPPKMRLVLTWPRLFLPGSPPHPARAKLVLTSPRVLPSRIATTPGQNKACFVPAAGTAFPDRHHSRPEQSLLCSRRRHCPPAHFVV